ncbi:MAG: DUF6497 family protein [Pseudomonadota bacterium]
MLARGGGCALILTLLWAQAALATDAPRFDVPSGEEIRFLDSFYQDAGDGVVTVRFRFVMPAIAGGRVPYAQVADDFLYLCAEHALPSLEGSQSPDKIIISLADQEVPFGKIVPEATQFFEAFRIENADCIWEGF